MTACAGRARGRLSSTMSGSSGAESGSAGSPARGAAATQRKVAPDDGRRCTIYGNLYASWLIGLAATW